LNAQTCLLGEPLVNHSQSQDCEKDWMTHAVTWRSSIVEFLITFDRNGLSGKMSPVSCQAGGDGTLVPSSGRWLNSGMGSPTECLTLNGSEWPSAAAVCSLSDILETGDLPQRFFLSTKACAGILRRAEKRGKTLPPALHQALTQMACKEPLEPSVQTLTPEHIQDKMPTQED
jgi:hypothetical protein